MRESREIKRIGRAGRVRARGAREERGDKARGPGVGGSLFRPFLRILLSARRKTLYRLVE